MYEKQLSHSWVENKNSLVINDIFKQFFFFLKKGLKSFSFFNLSRKDVENRSFLSQNKKKNFKLKASLLSHCLNRWDPDFYVNTYFYKIKFIDIDEWWIPYTINRLELN